MKPLWEVADLLRRVRREMRFGELSRAPLRLLRLQWRTGAVECDWLSRPPDQWDTSLRRRERDRSVSQQALRDAIRFRDLIFSALPGVETAVLRAFRPSSAREPPNLIIAGDLVREAPAVLRVSSLAMRAKLYGFRFDLQEGVLQVLQFNEGAFEVRETKQIFIQAITQ